MRILFYQWHSFMNRGVEAALRQLGAEYDVYFYQQQDWERDAGIVEGLRQRLDTKDYAMVLSINFAPLVSAVCEEKGVIYAAWVYDDPLHIRDKSTLKNNCNRVFFFDRVQAAGYAKEGVHAFHLPLAADVGTFGGRRVTRRAKRDYRTDVSMVGKLYRTDYEYYLSPLTQIQRGYLDGILNAQSKVYGGYFLGEMLDDKLLAGLNESYSKASNGKASITKEELEYMMACEITGRERFMALALLSRHFDGELYSSDEDERLDAVRCMGYADYYGQMPGVFSGSRINLNISLKIIQSGIPLRVFDVLGCGGFLLTNFQAEMPEIFTPGEDFVVYDGVEDLYAKAEYYLRHDDERERIARHGYKTVERDCTFAQRMEELLRVAGEDGK